ncbi:MAG: zinc ribbon domain-containing protein [Clostridia bacterium]|nr:zinc ribbon domain-containing protein [Clostridia bacterium]
MALITCPECGKQISDRAKACPHCGFDLNAPKCPDCGTYLPEGAAACPSCGCPVEAAAPAAAPAPAVPAAPAPGGGTVTMTFPAPHAFWRVVPQLVIMDEGGHTTYGVVEWNKTVTIDCRRPETLSIRRNDEAEMRRKNKFNGTGLLVMAAALCLLPFAVEDLWAVWAFAVILAFFGVMVLIEKPTPIATFSVTPGKAYEFYWNDKKLEAHQIN